MLYLGDLHPRESMQTASIHKTGPKGIPLGESRLWAVGMRRSTELQTNIEAPTALKSPVVPESYPSERELRRELGAAIATHSAAKARAQRAADVAARAEALMKRRRSNLPASNAPLHKPPIPPPQRQPSWPPPSGQAERRSGTHLPQNSKGRLQ